jgi:hypothetical protein
LPRIWSQGVDYTQGDSNLTPNGYDTKAQGLHHLSQPLRVNREDILLHLGLMNYHQIDSSLHLGFFEYGRGVEGLHPKGKRKEGIKNLECSINYEAQGRLSPERCQHQRGCIGTKNAFSFPTEVH